MIAACLRSMLKSLAYRMFVELTASLWMMQAFGMVGSKVSGWAGTLRQPVRGSISKADTPPSSSCGPSMICIASHMSGFLIGLLNVEDRAAKHHLMIDYESSFFNKDALPSATQEIAADRIQPHSCPYPRHASSRAMLLGSQQVSGQPANIGSPKQLCSASLSWALWYLCQAAVSHS